MNLLDFINVTTLSIILMFIGALGIIWLIKPLDKVIMFAVMEAGFMLAVVSFKYLDVALVIALFGPITTLIFLLSIIKINEIRKNKKDNTGGKQY
jgi:energy-converting hydrogenase A subunit D